MVETDKNNLCHCVSEPKDVDGTKGSLAERSPNWSLFRPSPINEPNAITFLQTVLQDAIDTNGRGNRTIQCLQKQYRLDTTTLALNNDGTVNYSVRKWGGYQHSDNKGKSLRL